MAEAPSETALTLEYLTDVARRDNERYRRAQLLLAYEAVEQQRHLTKAVGQLAEAMRDMARASSQAAATNPEKLVEMVSTGLATVMQSAGVKLPGNGAAPTHVEAVPAKPDQKRGSVRVT